MDNDNSSSRGSGNFPEVIRYLRNGAGNRPLFLLHKLIYGGMRNLCSFSVVYYKNNL